MDEVIQVADQYYVLATSSLLDDRTRVLKHDDTFAVFDRLGDIHGASLDPQGLYHDGTRFLSLAELRLEGVRPLLLSSTVRADNAVLAVHLTNPDLPIADGVIVPRGILHVFRQKLLWQGCCYERIRVSSFANEPVRVRLTLRIEADFRDVFEVRGTPRERRGHQLREMVMADGLELPYLGLDGVTRRTRVWSDPPPLSAGGGELTFSLTLAARGRETLDLRVLCDIGDTERPPPATFDLAVQAGTAAQSRARQSAAEVTTSNPQFNAWLDRSLADLQMMATETPYGSYPYAGIPWFSTPFGRDGIVTALECLWIDPTLARGVLGFLAETQATDTNPAQDAEPGKILHEARRGEMAALGEVPFLRYYGSVDATPLFVVLAGAYYERTGDLAFVETIWPHVERALAWIDHSGDSNRDGFTDYARQSSRGLVNQGWKDSHDAIFHADGALAEPPVALCEVQGYVHLAKRRAAELATALGHLPRAAELVTEARELQLRFQRTFWSERLSSFVLAVDGAGRRCEVPSSNAGQSLFTRIASAEQARRVAAMLLGPEMFSGWGVRTIGTSAARYNPMAYHNGSVWPHDNALIAWGLARHGCKEEVLYILDGLFDVSQFVELNRMPELFCGFERRPEEGPTRYPVACTPQSWAAGAVLLLLQACLGVGIHAPQRMLRLDRPVLPARLRELHVRNLRVADAACDLDIVRHADDLGITVSRKVGVLEVVVVK